MKGELSENDLKYKAEAYCSSMERCVVDVEAKLSQWGTSLPFYNHKRKKNFCSMSSDHLWILEATFPHVSVLPWAIYPVT